MLIEAVYDNGRLLFDKKYSFAHNRFKIKVDVPEAELVDKITLPKKTQQTAPAEDLAKQTQTQENVVSEYPAEYLEFKKLQNEMFGPGYVYKSDKSDKEILIEALCEKYA